MSNLSKIETELSQYNRKDLFTILMDYVKIRLENKLDNYSDELKHNKNIILSHAKSTEISKELVK